MGMESLDRRRDDCISCALSQPESWRSMVCLANDGRADWKSGGCIEHGSDVLSAVSLRFFNPARVEG